MVGSFHASRMTVGIRNKGATVAVSFLLADRVVCGACPCLMAAVPFDPSEPSNRCGQP
jgi:hypothetical protein